MKTFRLLTATALASASICVPFIVTYAQETPVAPAAPPADDAATESIIVTGSRILRPNLESTVPITTIQGAALLESGKVTVGDVLNKLPSLRSTYGQSNSTRFLGTAGLNLLDLRGLGTQRTLVLVNGRRHVGGDILNNAVSPDINTFPTDLIERVDIVTGGNSAIYGSDAIAGVVNFILKRDFDGLEMRGQGGTSNFGDANSYYASVLAGSNFSDGRGNIAMNAEYARQDEYYGSKRPFKRQDAFVVVNTDPAGAADGSNGIPDRLFFTDIRSAGLNNTGIVRFGGNANLNAGRDGDTGAFFNVPYTFNTDGSFVPLTGQRIGIGPNGSFVGGNGENFRGGKQFQLAPQLDRYSFNVIGHYDISDAFVPFVEAKYVQTRSVGTGNSGPAFITGGTLGDTRERPTLDNPFLSDQARATIIQQLDLANGAAPAPGPASRFSLRLNMQDLGSRVESAKRDTYRAVAGVRGEFGQNWNYEVAANYGVFREKTKVLGNLNIQRFLLGIDAARDSATGNIVCRAKIDPTAALAYVTDENGDPRDQARLDADIAACTPVNLFGGRFTQAQRAYLLQDTTSVGKITQFDVSAFVSGDSSQWFELPGGPVGVAVGAEYRREKNSFKADQLVEDGYTFYNALPTFSPPAFGVKEAYGELRLPLLKDVPFIQELTVSGAGRVAKYKGSTGTVYSYNGGVDYAPFSGLRLRGNYARAVRAPNLVELFSAQGQNFATVTDPCSARNIAEGTAARLANCRAAGVPAGYDFVYSQSLEIVSGGNPLLKAETSDSLTLGGVFQPEFIPGLSVSADYYNIKVNKVITSVSAQDIIDQCYDQASLSNVFCTLFQRAGSGGGPRGEEASQILEGSLLQSSLNFAKLQVRGIDAEVNYTRDLGSVGKVTTRLVYTHVFQNDQFLNPADPAFADRILSELGDPQDEFNLNSTLKRGRFTFGYDLQYIGKQYLNSYEDFNGLQGRAPENADYADRQFYKAVFYHDARVSFDPTDTLNFYLGVNNFTNKLPPLGLSGIGGGSGIYDARGRFFFFGMKAKI
jgi:outer membrane receptor protein involved in Fe transport